MLVVVLLDEEIHRNPTRIRHHRTPLSHVLGEAIEGHPQEVLIKADLRTFLAKQYAADHITPQEIETVIKQLEAYSAADLYENNKAIMKLVSDGFLLKREDRSQKDLPNMDRNPRKLSGPTIRKFQIPAIDGKSYNVSTAA